MIKLFRNIRKKLLKEGKTTNYLKYAIGEIVLVVIGILIALQINNWNENRKIAIQLNGYLNSISKNIQSDTTEIIQIRNLRKYQNLAAKDYMHCIVKDSISLELVSRIAPIVGEQYLNVDQSGFDALKSSGFITNLQGSSVEDAIYDYYAFFEEIHESETSLNNFIENLEVGFYNDDFNKISGIFTMEANQGSTEKLNQTLNLLYHNSKLLGIMQRVVDEEYFWVYDSLKTKGQKIVKLIESKQTND